MFAVLVLGNAKSTSWMMLQFVLPVSGMVLASMPLGFVADRAAGQQALLRLTGLGPLRVFTESVLGSLWACMLLGLFMVPPILAAGALSRAPATTALAASLMPLAFCVWLGSVGIVGMALSPVRSVATVAAALAGLVTLLPLAMELWLAPYLPGWVRALVGGLGGVADWSSVSGVLGPGGAAGSVLRVEARMVGWSLGWLAVGAWAYCRDWRQRETLTVEPATWLRRLRWLWLGPRRSPVEGMPYLRRFPEFAAWRWLSWVLALVFAGVGVGATLSWTWLALPCVLTGWLALVDMLAHLHVAGVPAEDRREGALELLFTTPLKPSELLDAGDRAGHAILRTAWVPGISLSAVFVIVGVIGFRSSPVHGGLSSVAHAGLIFLPFAYAWALEFLKFRVAVSQSLNTGEPFHSFSVPLSTVLMPAMTGALAWILSFAVPGAQFAASLLAVLIGLVLLVARENFAAEEAMDDEGLRTVAAAPLPVGDVIPKDARLTRPWVAEGFQR